VFALLPLLGACSEETVAVTPSNPNQKSVVETQANDRGPRGVHAACRAELREFLDALTQLNSELRLGLTFDDYGPAVGDIRVTYDRIEVTNVGPECLAHVALPAEKALNRYVEADNIWKNCEDELSCTEEQIMPKLRSKWRQATTQIEEAESGLASLRR
jgi:hypothetical protein